MSKEFRIILASGSIWRKRLLEKHGYNCRRCTTHFEEKKVGLPAEELVLYNAVGKARLAAKRYPNEIIVGADTMGIIGSTVLTKPRNRAHALRMLKSLSGKSHRIVTGICLVSPAGRLYKDVVSATVTFKKLSMESLGRYLDSGQWQGKAGSYAIQGLAKSFIDSVEGSHSTIVGLPIEELSRMIAKVNRL
ncbi:septum formation protein Maf [Candidatus Peregrinibacteria bacterium CG_4_9_14_0_2_um_filter_53_11]|nr:MAG: septum formation protein Maf [Candidatus Peregrinibacteria bacterium CG_4_9_14_0_2_um_filter_53_11]